MSISEVNADGVPDINSASGAGPVSPAPVPAESIHPTPGSSGRVRQWIGCCLFHLTDFILDRVGLPGAKIFITSAYFVTWFFPHALPSIGEFAAFRQEQAGMASLA